MSSSHSYIQTYATRTLNQQAHEAASQAPTHQPNQLALFSHNLILNTTKASLTVSELSASGCVPPLCAISCNAAVLSFDHKLQYGVNRRCFVTLLLPIERCPGCLAALLVLDSQCNDLSHCFSINCSRVCTTASRNVM